MTKINIKTPAQIKLEKALEERGLTKGKKKNEKKKSK